MPEPLSDGQILRQLAAAFAKLQREHSAMRVVLRAAVVSHPDRRALGNRLAYYTEFRAAVDQGQPLSDEDIAERKADLAKWQDWIERGP